MLGALALVLWGVGSSGFLIWQTRIIPDRATRYPLVTFWEMFERVSGISTWVGLALLVLALMALAALWLGLSRWLDPQGHARSALIWPARTWPFWMAALTLLLAAGIFHERLIVQMTATGLGLLALLAMPWLVWTPPAVEDDAPHWARPRWPGLLPVIVWLGGGALLTLAGFMLEVANLPSGGWAILVFAVQQLISALWALLTASLWLRGTWPARAPVSAFLQGRVVSQYFWLLVAFAGAALLLLAPLLTVMIQAIFILPQLSEAAQLTHQPLPAPVVFQVKFARSVEGMLDFGVSILATLYFALILGRWLWLRRMAADDNEGLALTDR